MASQHRGRAALLAHPRSPIVLLLTIGLVAVAIIGYQLIAGPRERATEPGGEDLSGSSDLTLSSAAFTVTGDLTEQISPGVTVPIDLRLSNPNDAAVAVTGVRVIVRSVDAPRADAAHPCGLDDFTVTQPAPGLTLTLPARGSSTLSGLDLPRSSWPRIGMVNRARNQDGCQGASLRLAYAANGRSGS